LGQQHIDILCARFGCNHKRFDVVVPRIFSGDILSDWALLAPAPSVSRRSANLKSLASFPVLFEASARLCPDIYGKNTPIRCDESGR